VLAGSALAYSALLRVFPGLVGIGLAVAAMIYLAQKRRLPMPYVKMLGGGLIAAAVLVPASMKVCGADSYTQFARHTLEVHDRTPLTNHMGLRVLISHNIIPGPASGRMKYTKDDKLIDPFEVWKRMRNERYAKYRFVAYGIVALSLAFFAWVIRRVKTTWVVLCLSQIFIILLSQLTCYYYTFMVLTAPLTRVKRQIEVPLLGFTALTQFMGIVLYWYDDRFAALTLISLLFCYGLVCAFAPPGSIARLLGRKPAEDAA
jgi:hypothetical protein